MAFCSHNRKTRKMCHKRKIECESETCLLAVVKQLLLKGRQGISDSFDFSFCLFSSCFLALIKPLYKGYLVCDRACISSVANTQMSHVAKLYLNFTSI